MTLQRMALLGAVANLDPDAAAFIAAVETADGQALETAVRIAYNTFFVSCKSDGMLSAIKAACILCGARTLAGALVPLVGPAPTNFNFVSANYNRKTGLAGDGSTKYLNTNRNNNADPQNSKHLAVYVSAITALDSPYMAAVDGVNGTSILYRRSAGGNGDHGIKVHTNVITAATSGTGFFGASRSSSSLTTFRSSGSQGTTSEASQTPSNADIAVFRTGLSGNYGTARLAFYSIGESLDLALLDSRVTTLINAISAAIP